MLFINFPSAEAIVDQVTADNVVETSSVKMLTATERQRIAGLNVTSIAALKAITVAAIPDKMQVIVGGYYAHGDGGGGIFYYDASASDTDNGGTVIAPDSGSGRWKRIYSGAVNVKFFGAKGDGSTNDNDAFRLASALVTALDGGTLYIPAGKYIVGKQDFAGETGQGYSYRAHDVIRISECTTPVTVLSDGAVIKVADGLKYGSFNPTTGDLYTPSPGGFTDDDYKATCPNVIYTSGCTAGVRIEGKLEIDGNSSNSDAGGYWGDVNYQVDGRGLYSVDDINYSASGIYAHHHVLDGCSFRGTADSFDAASCNATFTDCTFEYNGRQGLSLTGGVGISFYSCRFNHTARGSVSSAPRSGLDIEPTSGRYVSDVSFYNCEFINNTSTAFLSDIVVADAVRDITCYSCVFQASDTGTIWVRVPKVMFVGCKIKGGYVTYTYDSEVANDPNQTMFINCEFSDEPYAGTEVTTSFTTKPFNNMGGGFFQNCIFHNKFYGSSSRRYIIYSFYDVPHIYQDCKFLNYSNEQADNASIGLVRGATFVGANEARSYHTGENAYFISASTNDNITYNGSLLVTGLKWGASVAAGFDGDVAQYYRTAAAKFLQAGTATNGTFARVTAATSVPTSGQWYRGDIILNTGVSAAGQTSYWQCITSGWLAGNWAGSTSYSVGAVRKNGSNFYIATAGGTSASSGGPTGTGTGITDGTVTWDWLSSTTAVLQAKTL